MSADRVRMLVELIASRIRARSSVASLVVFVYFWCRRARGNAVHLTVRKMSNFVLSICNCPTSSTYIKARLNFLLSCLAYLAKRMNMEDALNVVEANRLVYIWDVEKLRRLLEDAFPEIVEIWKMLEDERLRNIVLSVLCEEACRTSTS